MEMTKKLILILFVMGAGISAVLYWTTLEKVVNWQKRGVDQYNQEVILNDKIKEQNKAIRRSVPTPIPPGEERDEEEPAIKNKAKAKFGSREHVAKPSNKGIRKSSERTPEPVPMPIPEAPLGAKIESPVPITVIVPKPPTPPKTVDPPPVVLQPWLSSNPYVIALKLWIELSANLVALLVCCITGLRLAIKKGRKSAKI